MMHRAAAGLIVDLTDADTRVPAQVKVAMLNR